MNAAYGYLKVIKPFGAPSYCTNTRARLARLASLDTWYAEKDKMGSEDFVALYQRAFLHGTPVPGMDWSHTHMPAMIAAVSLERLNALTGKWMGGPDRDILVLAPAKDCIVHAR